MSCLNESHRSNTTSYDILVGVGLVKDSDAVFFQYKGDDKKEALRQDNDKPVTRIAPVQITNVKIEENPYANSGFSGTKLNIEFVTQGGRTVCLTSGLTTMWSQCMITALCGLMNSNGLGHLVAIDSWKGNSKYGTCFASIRANGIKVSDQAVYDTLKDARATKNFELRDQVLRDSVAVLQGCLSIIPAQVTEAEEVQF